ncbi:MAG: hypothetical protein A2Y74_07665 [Actinobacteria bacterium RBG_13_63_9]|nr:MAG: hypothetical protein A2Y74_07665 [Actinobacteria bacterium RBG_13_63_9]
MYGLKYDAAGLIPAVVQEAETGQILMVAYMNVEALRRTLKAGEAWFWSRSRSEFWHKGEKSGNVLKVRRILTDCDRDALVLVVRERSQLTPICHTGRETCFGWEVVLKGGRPAVRAVAGAKRSFVTDARQGSLPALKRLVALLRRERGGCPWDRKQTLASLKEHLVAEVYEVVNAVDSGDDGALKEELGDLLFLILMDCQIASEHGLFALEDVVGALAEKIVSRHAGRVPALRAFGEPARRGSLPGEGKAAPSRAAKKLADLPSSLPALLLCQKLHRRAWRTGLAAKPTKRGVVKDIRKCVEALALRAADGMPQSTDAALADLLVSLSLYAQLNGQDAEEALRRKCLSLREELRSASR